MRMKKFLLPLCLLFTINMLTANNGGTAAIDFYNGSLTDAKAKAKSEGKLFFVDFYAKWCAPCKWMDETTFSDAEVTAMLNANFVSMKVDIDDFDGFSLKQQYKIKYLPTILIFNSKGELIDRMEETMSPRKMLEFLEGHHSKNTGTKKVTKVNQSPSKTRTPYRMTASEEKMIPTKDSYRVQVGTYTDFKNTFNYVNELKEIFAEPIIVLNDYAEGKIVYRIMMGEFKTKNEASSFVEILKQEFGISAIVK